MAQNKRDEIALGLGPYLYPFARATNASPFPDWNRDGLTSVPLSLRTFEAAFREAARNARRIHFNLQGIRDPVTAVDRGRNLGFVVGNFTNAELDVVRNTPEYLKKTTFYRQGMPVGSPFP